MTDSPEIGLLNLAGDHTLALLWGGLFLLAAVCLTALVWYGWRTPEG
jgi:hypothetical protein